MACITTIPKGFKWTVYRWTEPQLFLRSCRLDRTSIGRAASLPYSIWLLGSECVSVLEPSGHNRELRASVHRAASPVASARGGAGMPRWPVARRRRGLRVRTVGHVSRELVAYLTTTVR